MSKPDPLRVLLLSRYDRLGASSRLRFLDYLPALAAEGIDVTVSPFFDDAYLETLYGGKRASPPALIRYYIKRVAALCRHRDYDLIWLEKEALPFLPWWLEGRLLGVTKLLIDFDDAWFHRYDMHRNELVRWCLGGKFPKLVRRANLIVTGSDYLTSWMRRQGVSALVQIPTVVEPAHYQAPLPPTDGKPFTIGWMGSPGTASYLYHICVPLAALCADGNTVVQLVGSGPVTLDGVQPTILPWRESEEAERLRHFDVGIMPLTPDPWSQGKCAYKLIQYMAAGLPVVASPVGMNRQVVRPGINGFLAETAAEWQTALTTLRDDPALRRRMGEAGRTIVEAGYARLKTAPRLAEALRQAANSRNYALKAPTV